MEAFRVIADLPKPGTAAVHAENHALCERGMARLRTGSPKTLADWTESSPECAEAEAVRFCAFAARRTGARVYVVHLSSASGLEAVREAKEEGAPLCCESTSTYLFHDNAEPAGMKLRRYPPVRTVADREALWTGVADGSIETLGTDNVTATAEENNFAGPFWENRGGMPGLPTHVAQILHAGHHERGLPLWLLADRMCRRPAEVFGLYPRKGALDVGADADLVVVDPDLRRTVRGAESGSRSDFTPLEGRRLRGWPVTVVKGGEVVVEERELVCDPGVGRCLNKFPG
ncbi:MAG: dihydroorotase family protein [Nitrospinota bacterium]